MNCVREKCNPKQKQKKYQPRSHVNFVLKNYALKDAPKYAGKGRAKVRGKGRAKVPARGRAKGRARRTYQTDAPDVRVR